MKLIVGLGNRGEKYRDTRHNIGFIVVEKLVKDLLSVEASVSAWKNHNKFMGLYARVGGDLLVIKPQTYMNLSGVSVKKFVDFYKVDIDNLWVVHDDIDLSLGRIRIRVGGASGGHRGVDSIIKELNSPDFIRFRLGIGRGKLDFHHTMDQNIARQKVEKFVLSPFTDHEAGEARQLIEHAVDAVRLALMKDLERAMNEYN